MSDCPIDEPLQRNKNINMVSERRRGIVETEEETHQS
jgi:hypothetical protein